MSGETEIVVIGAGPAGLAAAALAAREDVKVVLLDEQSAPGGQIYRGVERAGDALVQMLGTDYARGRALCEAVRLDNVRYIDSACVFELTPDREVYYTQCGKADLVTAQQVIVATGAMERPMPFPGWTLPGVMTAGGAQIALKSAGLIPSGRTVLAGSGPLLYLLAAQLLQAGTQIDALVETTPFSNWRLALRNLPSALLAPGYLRKGLAMLRSLGRHGVKHYRHAQRLEALGVDKVEGLRFEASGRAHELACDLLLVHAGVAPNVQLTRALGLAHDYEPTTRVFRPRVDRFGATSLDGIFVAGDSAGIGGAHAAAFKGQLCALAALARTGAIDVTARDRLAQPVRASLARDLRIRPFLDALYAPAREYLAPPDETIVCRCEEVTAAQIRGFVALGCLGPNQTKAFGRPGMGPCQGRFCGLTVSEIIAAERGVPVAEVGYYRIRPPIKPVTLGELAAMPIEGSEE